MKLKALKSLAALPIVAAVFVLRDYAKTVLTVLFCALISFVCFVGIWLLSKRRRDRNGGSNG